jgi:tRNA-dihydrouridine synthase B
MKKNFWQKLKDTKKPILALAPMAGFSDAPFRQICKKNGADVLYSEMASAAAIYYADRSRKSGPNYKALKTMNLLKFDKKKERFYVVQLFGSDPKHFAVAARVVTKDIKPDGIDINFGCPVPKICKQGAGSGLMKDLSRSRAVVEAVLENTNLPVSIKIRLHSGDVNFKDFLKNISDLPVSALMIHARTLKQGFAGEADFKAIKEARQYFKGVLLVNGGINNLNLAKEALKLSGADGLGLARGVLGRPYLFKEIKTGKEIKKTTKQIYKMIYNHATLWVKLKKGQAFVELRKNLVWYLSGLPGAAKKREALVKVEKLKDVEAILKR